MSKILITGAGGLVGSAICKNLFLNGIDFLATYRSLNFSPPWHYLLGDLQDDNFIEVLLKKEFNTIIHVAAAIPNEIFSYESCYEINQTIDNNINKIIDIKTPAPRLVFISTTNVYGLQNGLITEENIPVIDNKYAERKFLSENLFLQNSSNSIVLRINAPYSPSQIGNTVLKIFIEKSLKGEDIFYHGTGARQQDFTHVDDIAEAVLKCIQKDNRTGIFNISSGKPISMKDLASLIVSKIKDCKSKILPSGSLDSQESYRALFSIEKAKKELKWKPKITLEEGINDWLNHLKR